MGPRSYLTDAVSVAGLRSTRNCGRIAPNRWFTSYEYRRVSGSNPRTYRSDWSGEMFWPQPRRLPEPLISRSAAPSGLEIENETAARCGMRNFALSSVMFSDAFVVHGPRQLFRLAILPICFCRHSRAASDVFA